MTPGVPIGFDLKIKTKTGILYLKVIWEIKMAPLRIKAVFNLRMLRDTLQRTFSNGLRVKSRISL